MQGEILEAQLAYWRARLDPQALLSLPTDRPRPTAPSARGARSMVTLPQALSESVKALAQREGRTLFVILLGAFQVLLWRVAAETDVTVGTVIAGRTRADLEGLVGPFINTLALRVDLADDPTFREALGRIHEATLGAFAHQDLPFEKLVSALGSQRKPGRTPLFQVMFILQSHFLRAPEMPGMVLDAEPVDTGTTQFELTLIAADLPKGLRLIAEYATDLFDAATIERMIRRYEVLLSGAVARPDARISELPLLSSEERHQLLVTWNDTAADYPREACVHELFEAQVERTPEAVAVVFEEEELSYRALNLRANRLAHRLRSLGVGPEVLVGLCVERSLEMVVGLLGILKAGGAYVPLDPSYPRERLAFMAREAAPPVLLLQRHLEGMLPPQEGVGIVYLEPYLESYFLPLDGDGSELAREREDNPPTVTRPDNLAYVIYTSGSTGKPKGVMIRHGAAVSLAVGLRRTYEGLRSPLRVAQNAPFSFDASVKQWLRLLSGDALHLVPQDDRLDTSRMLAFLRAHAIDVLDCTPTQLVPLLDGGLGEDPESSPRLVLVGGEAIDPATWDRLAQSSSTTFVNVYGPTECTVDTTARRIEAGSPPSLGGPLANVRVYLLDGALGPSPQGAPGELYIGGAGVARGYLREPARTAERFVPDPFAAEPGARMYRTGDLARWTSRGELEFLGRRDHQVKIRGFRIELGEIEGALGQHPAVREAVVLVREDRPGDKRLVAYLVAHDAAAQPERNALRADLRQKLPEYMIPAAFVWLPALPRSPSGKLDRRALPAPDVEAAEAQGAPRTPLEEMVAGIWADVLGRAEVGVLDNFFELGGHSLLATQVVSRLRSSLGVELPLRELFEAPTVVGLRSRIEAARRAGAPLPPPITLADRGEAIPLSFAQQRLWFLDQLTPGSAFYNMPAIVRLDGPLDASALRRALEEIARRHEVLRTTFVAVDGQARQVISPEPSLPLTVIDLGALAEPAQGAEARRLAAEEAQRPFVLAEGPLARATLLRLSLRSHLLVLAMHHIVTDGWSLGVVVRELGALHAAFQSGQPSPLPELPLQYADFAAWQRGWLAGEVLKSQLAYWKDKLGGGLSALELPTDRPRPPVQTHRGAPLPTEIPRELVAALLRMSRREGVTLFMTLLAAFQVLLHRYSGQDDIVVGSPVANRTRAEIEGLVGFFLNMLVLRTDLSGAPTFREVLGQVREVTLGAYAHQDVPFEKLVEELVPARDMSRSQLFQVMFVLQNTPTPTLSFGELEVCPLPVESTTAKFDLLLAFGETVDGFFRGALEYSTDLFDTPTIARMLGHYQVLLGGIVESPGAPISALPWLAPEERRELLVTWNATAVDYPKEACLHELFEAQAEKTPEAVAVVFEKERLSYGELNRRANQLAHHLRSLGVGPEVLVGLCVERSLEMVIGLLGILKAGGAYVPLDPTYPEARLAFMVKDAAAPVLLVQERFRATLPEHDASVLCLDSGWSEIARSSEDDPHRTAHPDNLAYVIYTSGSTGRPKGAMNAHRGVVNRLRWGQGTYRLGPEDAVLQKTPFSFDVSVWELFWPLLNGARLVMARPEGHKDTAYLAELIRAQAVTVLHFVPSMLRVFLDDDSIATAGSSVQRVFSSGEALPYELFERLLQRWPGVRLENLYGPTEAAIEVTAWSCRPHAQRCVPMGKPIANTQAYVLDAVLQPAPIGVPGELYLGGVQVGRGYLRRPDLTAECFVPDPFHDRPGARLYRTGDLVRWLPDGELEFLGRRDFQVKVRGFRIELGEIESALGQHPATREAVVLAREDRSEDKRLVAYLVARDAAAQPEASALRDHLQQKLPEYMIPAVFVWLPALPLTPSGKVDRRALPAPDLGRLDAAEDRVAPRTPLEEMLAGMWAELLGRAKVGVFDNFFELGGHSLLGAQLVSRLRARAGIELPLRALFEAPTVAGLAERIEATQRKEGPLPPLFAPVCAFRSS